MSKYRVINCEFKSLESLKKALADLGVPYETAEDPRVPDLGLYGYHNDLRSERASIVIRRAWINEHWSRRGALSGKSNDVGFAWNGAEFAGIVSDYDASRSAAGLNQLRQRYAFHELNRLARAKGYNVISTTSEDGHIRIKIGRR